MPTDIQILVFHRKQVFENRDSSANAEHAANAPARIPFVSHEQIESLVCHATQLPQARRGTLAHKYKGSARLTERLDNKFGN